MMSVPPNYAAVLATAFLVSACASVSQDVLRLNDPAGSLHNPSKTAVYVPLRRVAMHYIDNTQTRPDTVFADSFYLESANTLLQFEMSKRLSVRPPPVDLPSVLDSLGFYRDSVRYSLLEDTGRAIEPNAASVRGLCARTGADMVLWPYSCALKYSALRPRGWRGEGPSYERPVEYSAKSFVHLQIWSKDGGLLFERIGVSDKGKPILYSVLKRDKPDEDMARYAKRLFAPPLVRSLYQGVQRAVLFP